MPRFGFSIAFLGCRANEEEADALRSHLLGLGGEEVPHPSPADVVIVNTCAVTGGAQAQSRREIRRAGRVQRGGVVLTTGCAAQLDPVWLARLPGVHLVLGNRAKARLPELLTHLVGGGDDRAPAERLAEALERVGLQAQQGDFEGGVSPPATVCWDADPTPERFVSRTGPIPHVRTRATLKVQDGCPYRCGFCIVSQLRGRPRSRDVGEVLGEARRLVAAGFREIVLTGVNLGLYGIGADEAGRSRGPGGCGPDLGDLIRALEAIEGLRRIRLSSLEPMTIAPDLLDQLAASVKVARHFHVAFQSGDDAILRRMGRPYDVASLEKLVAQLEERFPRFGLGVDIVAGYPGETAEAFGRTLLLLERLRVSYIHAFGYSERPGTPAVGEGGIVPHPVRRERVHQLRRLSDRLRLRFQESLAGQPCDLIVERAEDGGFEGLSGEYVRMRGRARDAARGDWLGVIAGASIEPGWQHCRLADAG